MKGSVDPQRGPDALVESCCDLKSLHDLSQDLSLFAFVSSVHSCISVAEKRKPRFPLLMSEAPVLPGGPEKSLEYTCAVGFTSSR